MRVKITKEVEEASNSKGKMMVLKCDKKSKEERAKREEQYKNKRIGARGNIGLRLRNRFYERRESEVIKTVDNAKNSEEHTQNKHGEKMGAFWHRS